MSTVKKLDPRIVTVRDFATDKVETTSAQFAFGCRNLPAIAKEWSVDRSNAKDLTISRGVQHWSDRELALKLVGHTFMIDRDGRNMMPALGRFSPAVKDALRDIVVTGETETFYSEDELLDESVRVAIRVKIFLKKILRYCRLTAINHTDGNIICFTVTGEDNSSDGLVSCLFQGGVEEKDLFITITETTDFELEEALS